MLITAKYQH